ncbi:hypothetical protein EYZ11_013153 [Aspergillus tanneri]|uniref:Uncharacterized protein n=1 Tax=Aspergillus tanneri TaxID=1220188 RepID=A0A4S3IYE2_9EURO|nr:hypothetical protein EYZ11_013153 [Aspergillus tanneri]
MHAREELPVGVTTI